MIGTYDKTNNKNFIITNFRSDNVNAPMEWMLRSQEYGGILFFRLKDNEIRRAYYIHDSSNQIIDGKLMSHYRMTTNDTIGMIYITQCSNPKYLNQYFII